MCSVARFWTRAATRPWKLKWCWKTARSAVPRCRRALRRARSRPSSCATATRAAISARAHWDAVAHVNEEIAEALIGVEADDQRFIDDIMLQVDGTDNKGALGANAILGASLACAKAAAESAELPLYKYVGGANAHRAAHAHDEHPRTAACHADNNVDFQEFMIMPVGASTFARRCAGAPRSTTR